jgi:hypothetical protein
MNPSAWHARRVFGVFGCLWAFNGHFVSSSSQDKSAADCVGLPNPLFLSTLTP